MAASQPISKFLRTEELRRGEPEWAARFINEFNNNATHKRTEPTLPERVGALLEDMQAFDALMQADATEPGQRDAANRSN